MPPQSKKYPLPITGWRHFPGYNVPNSFSEGQVYHYLVETVPDIVVDGRILSVANEDDGTDDEDFQVLKLF